MTADAAPATDDDPLVTCTLQGGTLSVHADRIEIERSRASIHEDKTIPLEEVYDVAYSGGFVTGYIQVQQVGLEPATGGLLKPPVDENTLTFSRGKRECATEARDAILERASASRPADEAVE